MPAPAVEQPIKRSGELEQLEEATVRLLSSTSKRPPIIELSSAHLQDGRAKFYVDTGADITIIKRNVVLPTIPMDYDKKLKIRGVTPGICYTIGRITIRLNGLLCEAHIVSNDFPIEEDAIIGWKTIAEHKGAVNLNRQRLEFPGFNVPFVRDESFLIAPKTRQIIYARVLNPETEMGFVPLMDLGPDILFGNFVTTNRAGRAYAECINIGDAAIRVSPPAVELIPCDVMPERVNIDEIFSEDVGELTRIFRCTEDKDTKARAEEVLKYIDLEGLNEQEKEHVRELIHTRPEIFGLPGEKLKATQVLTHKIVTTSDKPIRAKQYRHPPMMKEIMQKHIVEMLESEIIRPSVSDHSSPMWVVPKKPDAQGNKKWRLVTDFRKLNEITEADNFPLPITTDIIENVAAAV